MGVMHLRKPAELRRKKVSNEVSFFSDLLHFQKVFPTAHAPIRHDTAVSSDSPLDSLDSSRPCPVVRCQRRAWEVRASPGGGTRNREGCGLCGKKRRNHLNYAFAGSRRDAAPTNRSATLVSSRSLRCLSPCRCRNGDQHYCGSCSILPGSRGKQDFLQGFRVIEVDAKKKKRIKGLGKCFVNYLDNVVKMAAVSAASVCNWTQSLSKEST